jgi:ketosteroid isomerase-like protein
MKLLSTFAFVVLTSAILSQGGQEPVTKADKVIRDIEVKLAAALLQGDAATVEATLADEYIEINAQGLVRHKPDVMAIVRAQAAAPRSISVGPEISVNETNVRMFGDTAIFTGLTTTKYQHMEYQVTPQPASSPTPTATSRERFMKVYSKVNGRWQLVAAQITAIAAS